MGRYYTHGMSPRSRSPWGSRLLFLGVFLFAVLVALAVMSIRQEWQQRIGESRGEALFHLRPGGRHLPARAGEDPGPPHRDAGRLGLAQPRAAALPGAHRRSRQGAALRRGGGLAAPPLRASLLRPPAPAPGEPHPTSGDSGAAAPRLARSAGG